MTIETNVDDLTDQGVASFLCRLSNEAEAYVPTGARRDCLREIVRNLDSASPDWPHTVLGLPLIRVEDYRAEAADDDYAHPEYGECEQ